MYNRFYLAYNIFYVFKCASRCIHFDSFKGEKMMKSDMNKDTRAKGRSKEKTSTLVPSYSITDYSTWSRGILLPYIQ